MNIDFYRSPFCQEMRTARATSIIKWLTKPQETLAMPMP